MAARANRGFSVTIEKMAKRPQNRDEDNVERGQKRRGPGVALVDPVHLDVHAGVIPAAAFRIFRRRSIFSRNRGLLDVRLSDGFCSLRNRFNGRLRCGSVRPAGI